MSVKIGKGVPPPAKLGNIIKDVFSNEKSINADHTKTITTFSLGYLSVEQKATLVYTDGFIPMDIYLINQIDVLDADDIVLSTQIDLITFANKGNKFIYGFYYQVSNQDRFPLKELTKSKVSIDFSINAIFTSSNYFEVYNDVKGTTIILALSADNSPLASLQYSHKNFYYLEGLDVTGILNTDIPATELTGLSKNLKKIKEAC